MLQPNRLKAALAAGRDVFGLINSLPLPLMAEMIGYAGFDFVILDLEHVGVNPQTLENMIRAAECAGTTALVRVPRAAPDIILRVLDAGAQGIVVPHVCSRATAELAVHSARYHPLGKRGIAGGRTTGFGTLSLSEYMERANRELMVVAMIEDRAGVDAIEEIVAVPGIDMVLEGAIDLSQSLGVPADAQHPAVQAAIRRIAQACQARVVPFCAIPRAAGQCEQWREQGVHAFLLGDDRATAFRAMKQLVAGYRRESSG
ncbi:HpcH/HpaI aldolase family protein [Cupriavidus taiwanensis]|uniref:HpcH/HpaI aldolase family protein n=1 Tax=Cupriavidus taiwanensis TaxID=164546 RepID=UPI000E10A1A2|nr:aldolase/citrate lyase family protein [Cupriavidus taiwanensis]SOY63543.1 Aldolase [Cupriavidus taiwanensis]SOY63544.1 Aldolase [Cupriavidus taiwanensis]SOY93724.1 Aldolase [Cupriavidus taiwanensis]SOZ77355.1 Aldolase [Cupriavidus taiwanensis]SOZ85403.1 Aldolase [Cupriavidus taiwanensis]